MNSPLHHFRRTGHFSGQFLLLLILPLFISCSYFQSKPIAISPATIFPDVKSNPVFAEMRPDASASKDPNPDTPVKALMTGLELITPANAISSNENFWKTVNEHAVDVPTYDSLLKNGIRVGLALQKDWPDFQKIFDQQHATSRKIDLVSNGSDPIEMEVKTNIPSQTLFIFDRTSHLSGRTYDSCNNYFAFTYNPTPRKPGDVRVNLCPVVRSLRQRLEFTPMNRERDIRFISPEQLYDVGLTIDIPLGYFLIVAPSVDALQSQTTIGSAFLIKETSAERMERTLIFFPRVFRYEEKATPANLPQNQNRELKSDKQ